MKNEQLEKAYQAVDLCNEMEVQISNDLRQKVESLEQDYINNFVVPQIKGQLEELLKDFRSKVSISMIFSPTEGVDCGVAFVHKEENPSVSSSDEEEVADPIEVEQEESKQNTYIEVFEGGSYRIFEADTNECEEGVLPISENYDYMLAFTSLGNVLSTSVKDILSKPKNNEYRIKGFNGTKISRFLLCMEENRIFMYSKDPKGNMWAKALDVSYLVSDMYTQKALLPPNFDLLYVTIIDDDKKDIATPLLNNASIQPGIIVRKTDLTNVVENGKKNAQIESHSGYSLDYYIREQETDKFYVTFANGYKCAGGDASSTMVYAINEMLKYTTIQKLVAVDISVDKLPMISPHYISEGRTSFHELNNGWYVNTHMNNKTKKEKIELLAQRCGIKLSVYLKMKKV